MLEFDHGQNTKDTQSILTSNTWSDTW